MRANLKSREGTRVHSTGTHVTRRKFDVTPQPERMVARDMDDTSDFRAMRSLMQGNRGVL